MQQTEKTSQSTIILPASSLKRQYIKGCLRVNLETICMLAIWLALYHATRTLPQNLLQMAVDKGFLDMTPVTQNGAIILALFLAFCPPIVAAVLLKRWGWLLGAEILSCMCIYIALLTSHLLMV